MARVIETYCDGCIEAGNNHTLGQTYRLEATYSGEGTRGFEVDLCDEHASPLRAYLSALALSGRPVKARKDKGKRAPAPAVISTPSSTSRMRYRCDICGRESEKAQSATMHRYRAHPDAKPLGKGKSASLLITVDD